MSSISHAAYLSELYNLRNMMKAQGADLQQLNIRISELEQKESSECIDSWDEGEGVHDKPYSADATYKKIDEMIKEQSSKLDELIEKVDTLTELNTEQTQKINKLTSDVQDVKFVMENSITPTIMETSEKVDEVKAVSNEILEIVKKL